MVKDHLLREISHLHRGAEADQTGGGSFFAEKKFQEGGLARAVVAQKGDALPAGDHQIHVLKEGAVPKGLGEGHGGEHLVAVELPLPEGGGHGPALGGFFGGTHFFHALFHGEGPLVELVVAHKGPEVELVHRRLELLQLGLLLFVALQLLVEAAFLFHHIEGVVPGVKVDLALLQFHNAVHHPVQEVAVVGDGEDGALVLAEVALQPLGGVEVQVVGGLVQQEEVGVLQNETGQVDPGLFPAGEGGKLLLPHGLGDAQARCDLAQRGGGVVAPGMLILRRQRVVPGQQRLVLRSLGQLGGKVGELGFHVVEPGKGGVQHVLHRVAVGVDRDLGNEPHPAALGQRDGAAVGDDLPADHPKEGGFARAVVAQQAHPLPGVHLEGDVFK